MWRTYLPCELGGVLSAGELSRDKAAIVRSSLSAGTDTLHAQNRNHLTKSSEIPSGTTKSNRFVFYTMDGSATHGNGILLTTANSASVTHAACPEKVEITRRLGSGSISSISEDGYSVASVEDDAFVGMHKLATEFESGDVVAFEEDRSSPQQEPLARTVKINTISSHDDTNVMHDAALWRSATTLEGRVYFYHTLQRVSMWSLPAAVDPSRVKHKGPTPQRISHAVHTSTAADECTIGASAAAAYPPSSQKHPPLEPGTVARNLATELTAALTSASPLVVAHSATLASQHTAVGAAHVASSNLSNLSNFTPPAKPEAAHFGTTVIPTAASVTPVALAHGAAVEPPQGAPVARVQPSHDSAGAGELQHTAADSQGTAATGPDQQNDTPDPIPGNRFKPLPKRSAALRDKFRKMVRQGGVSSPKHPPPQGHSPREDPTHQPVAPYAQTDHGAPIVAVPALFLSPTSTTSLSPEHGASGSRWATALAAGEAARVPCSDCGRNFLPAALEVHARVCARVFGKTPNRFDAAKARVRNTPAARFNEQPKPCSRCGKRFGHTSDLKHHLQLCGGRGSRAAAQNTKHPPPTTVLEPASRSAHHAPPPPTGSGAPLASAAGDPPHKPKPFARTQERLSVRAANKAKWVFRAKTNSQPPSEATPSPGEGGVPARAARILPQAGGVDEGGSSGGALGSASSAEDESLDFFVPPGNDGTSPTTPAGTFGAVFTAPSRLNGAVAAKTEHDMEAEHSPPDQSMDECEHSLQSSTASVHSENGGMSFLGADVFASVDAFASATENKSQPADVVSAPRANVDESVAVEASTVSSVPPTSNSVPPTSNSAARSAAGAEGGTTGAAAPLESVTADLSAVSHNHAASIFSAEAGVSNAAHEVSAASDAQLSDMSADASAIVNEAPVACGSCGQQFNGAAKLCAHLTNCGQWRHQRRTSTPAFHSAGSAHSGSRSPNAAPDSNWAGDFPTSRVHHTEDAPVVPTSVPAAHDGMPPPSVVSAQAFDVARVPCPHCHRRFAPEVAEHHVFVCSKVTHRPSPPRSASAQRSGAAVPAADASPAPPPKATARRPVTPPRPSTVHRHNAAANAAARSISAQRTSPGMERLRSRGAYTGAGGACSDSAGDGAGSNVEWPPSTPAHHISGRPPTSSGRGLQGDAATPESYYLPTPFDRHPLETPDRAGASFAAHEAAAALVFSPK